MRFNSIKPAGMAKVNLIHLAQRTLTNSDVGEAGYVVPQGRMDEISAPLNGQDECGTDVTGGAGIIVFHPNVSKLTNGLRIVVLSLQSYLSSVQSW